MGNRPAARSTIVLLCAAIFFVATGARWWLIGRFGTDLPYLDQWDAEARFLYKPYFEDSLAPGAWFAAHNEHRIFFSRLLGLGLLLVNGQWDARLQMVVNAAIYAAVAGALFVFLSRGRSERFALLCAGGLSIVFSLPFGWENTLAGFQSQFYFLAAFSLVAIFTLPSARVLSWPWWIGILASGAALLAMASGLLAAASVLGVFGLVLVRDWPRRLEALQEHRTTAIFCLLVVALGLALSTTVELHAKTYQARSLAQFAQVFLDRLSWPVANSDWWWLASWSPYVLFLGLYLKRKVEDGPVERSILGLGLWVLLQAFAIALSRASAAQASRYTDLLSLGLVANAMCIAFLIGRHSMPRTPALAAIGIWLLVNGAGPYEASFAGDATIRKQIYETQRVRTAGFVATGDFQYLSRAGSVLAIPYPDPKVLAALLQDPVLRPILPVSVRTSLSLVPEGGAPEPALIDQSRPAPGRMTPESWDRVGIHSRFATIKAGARFEYRVAKESGLPLLFLYFSGSGKDLSIKDSNGATHDVHTVASIADGAWHTAFSYCPTAQCTISGTASGSGTVLMEPKEIGRLSVFALSAGSAGRSVLGFGILLFLASIVVAAFPPSRQAGRGLQAKNGSIA